MARISRIPGSAPVSGAGEGVLAFVDLSNHECTRMNTNFVGRLIRSLPLTHLSGLQSNLRRPRSELCVRRRWIQPRILLRQGFRRGKRDGATRSRGWHGWIKWRM